MYNTVCSDLMSILRNDSVAIDDILEKCNDYDYYKSLCDLATKHKLHPILLDILHSYKGSANSWIYMDYRKDYKAREAKAHNQIKTLELIGTMFPLEQFVWIKGMPLSTLLYGDPLYRQIGDIDLLVDPSIQRDVVDGLLQRGFRALGIVNHEIGMRYSVNYHEVQLASPYSSFLEIKNLSGEMDIFINDQMPEDFCDNTTQIHMCGYNYRTLNPLYTLIHLFLALISNSTSWFFMDDNGLREMYDIVAFINNYEVDYSELSAITQSYGIHTLIAEMMRKVNRLFGSVFSTDVLRIFASPTNKMHQNAELYMNFMREYEINDLDELFVEQKKWKAYYNALFHAYYDNDLSVHNNLLDKNLVSYNLEYFNDFMRLNVLINDIYFFDDTIRILQMSILSSKKQIHERYGYMFLLKIEIGRNQVYAYIENSKNQDVEDYHYDLKPKLDRNNDGKLQITTEFIPEFLDLKYKKICYNLQLLIPNDNDSEGFRITELCPVKNMLVILNTESYDM